MNKYHIILIVVFLIGAFSPIANKSLQSYQKNKAIKLNLITALIIIFLIYLSTK